MGLFLDDVEDFRQSFLFEFCLFFILNILVFYISKDDFFDFLLIIKNGYEYVGFEVIKR